MQSIGASSPASQGAMLYRLDHPPGETVELVLFRNVRNAAEIRKEVVAGKLSAAALKGSLVRPLANASRERGAEKKCFAVL